MLKLIYNLVELNIIVIQYTAFFLATWFVRISWFHSIFFVFCFLHYICSCNSNYASVVLELYKILNFVYDIFAILCTYYHQRELRNETSSFL